MVTGRKLLLADDSLTIQKVVDLTFTDEGMEVVTASDGQQALEKLEAAAPDIVLADVHMPQLNGYQLCELIKQDERFRHIPVMLLVGSFEPFDEAEARRVGADDYLTKPFQSIRTLIGKVHHLLSGEKAGLDEATTRQLTVPPEAEQANRSDPEFLERSTADTAPLPGVHDSEGEVGSRDMSFADVSMDDEMIETSPVSDYTSGERNFDPRSTMQYSAGDLQEAGIAEAVETPVALEETLRAYAPVHEGEHVAAPFRARPATSAFELASSDDALLDLGEIEPSGAMLEADDFFLDLLDESPAQREVSSSIVVDKSTRPLAYDSPAYAFVEAIEAPPPVELVETAGEPVAESVPTPGSTSDQEPFFNAGLPPTERLPADYRVEGATDTFDALESEYAGLVDASPQTGRITLDQISPEVIDAIARRAVEQLSERTVEQIAWEVVPALAERLITRRLEQEKE